MGASQSTNTPNGTLTLESQVVERHLSKLTELEMQVLKTSRENSELQRQLEDKTQKIEYLDDELEKCKKKITYKDNIINKNTILLRKSEESATQARSENNILMGNIARLQSNIADYEVNLKLKNEEVLSNKERDEKRYNKLQSQQSKIQTELQQYKSRETIFNLFNLYQQTQKLDTQIDATIKKFKKEMNVSNRTANQKELNKLTNDHDQLISTLKKLNVNPKNDLKVIRAKYNETCNENDKRTKEIMKKVHEINESTKFVSKQLQIEVSENINNALILIESYTKELSDLKQKSFTNDYKEEEKLRTNLLKIAREETALLRKESNEFQNNFPKSQNSNSNKPTNSKLNNPLLDTKIQNDTSEDHIIILYNFPDAGGDQDTKEQQNSMDQVRVTHFVRHLADDYLINDITVRRLSISDGNNVRPIVVTLPNKEIVNKILTSNKSVMNIKVVRFNGLINYTKC